MTKLPAKIPATDVFADEAERAREAMERFMKARDLNVASWAKAADIGDSTLRAFMSGRSNALRLDKLAALARSQNATISEMLGERVDGEVAPKGDVVPVRRLRVSAAMGGGFTVASERAAPPIFFRREWIKEQMADGPGELYAIDLEGDSNMPVINDGDVGVVLVGSNRRFKPGVYAAWDGEGLIVKYFESVPGPRHRLRVVSFNPIFPPYEVDADSIKLIGPLLWRGGSV
jgi:phage repressor protein C with HTH and peptisase S24 domain